MKMMGVMDFSWRWRALCYTIKRGGERAKRSVPYRGRQSLRIGKIDRLQNGSKDAYLTSNYLLIIFCFYFFYCFLQKKSLSSLLLSNTCWNFSDIKIISIQSFFFSCINAFKNIIVFCCFEIPIFLFCISINLNDDHLYRNLILITCYLQNISLTFNKIEINITNKVIKMFFFSIDIFENIDKRNIIILTSIQEPKN